MFGMVCGGHLEWHVECGMWNGVSMFGIQHIYWPEICCSFVQIKGGNKLKLSCAKLSLTQKLGSKMEINFQANIKYLALCFAQLFCLNLKFTVLSEC